MTFFNKVICFLKTVFVHIAFSLRVIISRKDEDSDGKTEEDTKGGKL